VSERRTAFHEQVRTAEPGSFVPELERSHDLVVNIAEPATQSLEGELSLVQTMGDTAVGMWNQPTNAWFQQDGGVADALEERDDDMDGLHSALMAELASGRLSLPFAMEMTVVARYYERLGDHAVNIARRVVSRAGPGQPS
jgi:phosphate transport system protein